MSIKLMTHVWDHSPQSGTELLMLLALADHANDEGLCWPSIARLAARCRIGSRQAVNVLHQLEAHGAIEVERGCGRGHPSLYRVKGVDPCTILKGEPGYTVSEKGVTPPQKGVTAITPEPLREPSREPLTSNVDAAPVSEQEERSTRGQVEQTPVIAPASRSYTPPITFTVTPAMRAWATKQYPSLDIDAVTTAFRARTFAEPQEDWGKVWFQMIRQAGEGRRRPVTVQDETSTWHKGPVQLPPVVRPDDVLTQAGLVEGSPAYTALYAQADAELVAEGLSPDLRKRPIVEARMTVIAERRQAGMEPPPGCTHPPEQVDADGRCHRCGVILDGCAAAH